MFTDDDNQWEEEDDDLTGEAVARFEEMLESQNPSYFDVGEFELIIDYYMQENDLKKCEARIAKLEERIAAIDEEMSDPEVATKSLRLQELTKEQDELRQELEKKYEEWETLAE